MYLGDFMTDILFGCLLYDLLWNCVIWVLLFSGLIVRMGDCDCVNLWVCDCMYDCVTRCLWPVYYVAVELCAQVIVWWAYD